MKFAIKDDANKNQALTVIPDDIISLISGGKGKGEGKEGKGGGGGGGMDCSFDRQSTCSGNRCHDRSSTVCKR